MIWAKRRFKWAEYADYQDRIGKLQDAAPTLQLKQQFMMVDVGTGEPGVNDHYIGLPNQSFLAVFDGFEPVSEDQLPKEIDGLNVAIVSEEFTRRFRHRSDDERRRLRQEWLAKRRRERASDNGMTENPQPPIRDMHPLPETPEAIAKGCRCKISRDANGNPHRGEGGRMIFVIEKSCHVHD